MVPRMEKSTEYKKLMVPSTAKNSDKTEDKKGKVSLTKIRRLMKLVNIRNILSLPLDVLETKYRLKIRSTKRHAIQPTS